MTRIARPHLPSLLLGALLGTTGLSVAGNGLFAEADATLASAQAELHAIDAATQRMHPHDARTIRAAVARVDAAHDQLALDLDTAQRRVQTLRDRAVNAELALAACEARPVAPARPPTRPPPPVVMGPQPVSPGELSGLVRALDNATFARDQLALLRDILPSRYFTVDQAIALVRTFSFERDQVEAAKMLYPHIVDPGQWYRMYSVFSFSSSKDDLRARTSG